LAKYIYETIGILENKESIQNNIPSAQE